MGVCGGVVLLSLVLFQFFLLKKRGISSVVLGGIFILAKAAFEPRLPFSLLEFQLDLVCLVHSCDHVSAYVGFTSLICIITRSAIHCADLCAFSIFSPSF